MRIQIKFHHLLLIGVLLLGSCRKDYVLPIPTPPPPPPGSIKFSLDIYPVLANSSNHCIDAGCHDSGSNAPDLSSLAIAYNSIKPGQMSSSSTGSPAAYCDTIAPANSIFYIRIHSNSPDQQMPVGGTPLSADYQGKVLQWITDGAKNN